MSRVFVLVKETYGDFDALQEEVICVSANKEVLDVKCTELKAQRTEIEIQYCVDYKVLPKSVKII